MTARIYEFGESPAREQDAFGFLEAQTRFLLLLWDIVLEGNVPVLNTEALTALCWMAGVTPMPSDKPTLMLSLQEVWHCGLGRPHAAAYGPWRAAVQAGDMAGVQRGLKALMFEHGDETAQERRLCVVVPMRLH